MTEETNEIWKDIPEYENLYQVSSLGRVKSLNYLHTRNEKILKPIKDINGYMKVNLCKENKRKAIKIHRLVCEAFLNNPNNLPQINHKNEIKEDNRVENLEFCDAKYNVNFGSRTERSSKANTNNPKRSKKIICIETGKIYHNARDIQRQFGFNQASIQRCCVGKQKSSYGLHFKYVD